MKKFILKNISLFSALIIIVSILNYLLMFNNKEQGNVRLHYKEIIENNEQADFIILGTSHAVHGIRPQYLTLSNLKVFNFALNGSNPEFYYKWYNEIFKKYYNKPQYILFCVEWFLFDEQWLWRKYEQDSEHFPAKIFLKNIFEIWNFDIKLLLLNRFPFIKYNKISDLEYLVNQTHDELFPVEQYDKGFIPYNGIVFNDLPLNPETISSRYYKYFNLLISQFVEENIKVVFVHIPECDIGNINYKEMESSILFNEIARKYNIPILNYNLHNRSYINDDKNFYSDWEHLNSKGSREFSKMLNKDLNTLLFHRVNN